MNSNLHMVLGDDLIEIDGQEVEVPAQLHREADGRPSVQLTKFLERAVYLVGHKRLDFKSYTENHAHKSAYAFRDSRFEALLKACCSFSTWADNNWVITNVKSADELLIARKSSPLQIRVTRDSIEGDIATPRVGDGITIRSPCFRPNLSIGYFFVISPKGAPAIGKQVARLYLNCTAKGACLTLLDLSRYAVERNLQFQAKFRNDPSDYSSSDSGVVYLSADDFAMHREALVQMLKAHEKSFVPKSSYFVTNLLPGVGLGIETVRRNGANRSFGEVEAAAFVKAFLNQAALSA